MSEVAPSWKFQLFRMNQLRFGGEGRKLWLLYCWQKPQSSSAINLRPSLSHSSRYPERDGEIAWSLLWRRQSLAPAAAGADLPVPSPGSAQALSAQCPIRDRYVSRTGGLCKPGPELAVRAGLPVASWWSNACGWALSVRSKVS